MNLLSVLVRSIVYLRSLLIETPRRNAQSQVMTLFGVCVLVCVPQELRNQRRHSQQSASTRHVPVPAANK